MKTKVVNINYVKPDVYIGRESSSSKIRAAYGDLPGMDGGFGNPITTRFPCELCKQVHKTPVSTLHCYRSYFINRVSTDIHFRTAVLNLHGLTLGCFCVDADGRGRCHGIIMASWIDGQFPEPLVLT